MAGEPFVAESSSPTFGRDDRGERNLTHRPTRAYFDFPSRVCALSEDKK